ncbi:MAG: Rdx family protein [Halobacteria archaeon]|nr:Rdx family protein [Halobacteria archaeon]
MTEVEIEYCVPCGLLDRAQTVQRELLEEFGGELEGVRLKTGEGGVFKIRVDGEKVYDKDEGNEDYDTDRIKQRVRELL